MPAADHSSPLRRALIKALKETPAIAEVVGASVYDEPPPTPVWPFIRYGGGLELPFEASCLAGQEVDLRLDAFAAGPGREGIDKLKKLIIRALDGARLTLTPDEGDTVVPFIFTMDYRDSRVSNDTAEPSAYKAVIHFTVITAQLTG